MIERIIPDVFLLSLTAANIPGDVVEAGSIAERAIQKASFFVGRIEWLDRVSEFDAVLAVDDGLRVGGSPALPTSKELTDRILKSEWARGTSVTVVRAFALIKRGEQPRVEVTNVPFKYLGNPRNVLRENGKYPLSQVLAPEGKGITVSEMAAEEEDAFNLAHSAESLIRLFA
jgi:hypothetical protein